MNIALAFHAGDLDQAVRWIDWVGELGGVSKHSLFLMPEKGLFLTCTPSGFKSVGIVQDYEGVQSDWSASNAPVRDASGPNSMIRQFAWHFHLNKLGPWMFIEPDAIPLRPDWADLIEAEYLASGKRCMGARVPKIGETPEHSTGNMVLPQDAAVLLPKLMLPIHAEFDGRRVQIAFDVAAATDILANFHETRLIQHVFRGPEVTTLDTVREDAVIFHTCKKGEIIPLLRKKLSAHSEHGCALAIKGLHSKAFPEIEVHEHEITPPVRNMNDPGPGFYAAKPKVYTYFAPVESQEGQKEQRKLIELWEQSWQAHGWFTHVLTEEDARKHWGFERYYSVFSNFPTVNPQGYDLACWLRWVAMATLEVGGIITDYDVINFGLAAMQLVRTFVPVKFPTILCDNNPVPCAVSGHPEQYAEAIEAFLDCKPGIENGQPHLSDMLAVQQFGFPAVDICKEYRAEGWRQARLIHFSHAACAGELRSKVISGYMHNLPPEPDIKSIGESVAVAPVKPTWIGTVRNRVSELAAMADTHSRRLLIIEEMRRIKLIPKARAR